MNENPEYPTDSLGTQVGTRWFQFALDFFLTISVFFLLTGTPVPEVNEPHYWIKAAHYWNPDLGGGDIFLKSGDVHWAFYLVFGYLTTFLPIVQAVWAGRWIIWLLIALGWTLMIRQVFYGDREPKDAPKPPLLPLATSGSWIPVAALVAPLWLAGLHWGNWAGEWVVGGAESKGVAYAFFFLGIGMIMASRWTLGWLSIGIGSVFHVVTGLWVIATVGLASILLQIYLDKWPVHRWLRAHILGWLLCIAGFAAGAIPAVQMDRATGSDAKSQAAVAQVFKRLSHHLSPTMFSQARWRGLEAMIGVSAALLLITTYARWDGRRRTTDQASMEDHQSPKTQFDQKQELTNPSLPPDSATSKIGNRPVPARWVWLLQGNRPFAWLTSIGLFAMSFAVIGLLIDLILSRIAPSFAASILRFYWFRWNEVVWPTLLGVVAVAVANRHLLLTSFGNTGRMRHSYGLKIVASIAMLYTVGLFWERRNQISNTVIPAGERQNFSLRTDTPEDQRRQFAEWIAVCDWISQNIHDHDLWLTPRRQQSFKWRTLKPELASWKDMPQNASAVVLWNQRIDAAYVFDEWKQLQPWTEDQILRIAKDYSVKYVLFDRRVMGQRYPKWEKLYPTDDHPNQIFSVYRIPNDLSASSSTAPNGVSE